MSKMLMDNEQKYGLISRLMHWLMAGLIIWQFIAAATHYFLSESNMIRGFFWPTHYTVGTTLFILVLFRGVWGIINLKTRPKYSDGFLGYAAVIGHLVLYVSMFFVPLLALLRAYGFGRGFSILGIEIFKNTGKQVPELMALGNNFHGEFGWLLLLLIIGHIIMVYFHRLILHDGFDKRMSR